MVQVLGRPFPDIRLWAPPRSKTRRVTPGPAPKGGSGSRSMLDRIADTHVGGTERREFAEGAGASQELARRPRWADCPSYPSSKPARWDRVTLSTGP